MPNRQISQHHLEQLLDAIFHYLPSGDADSVRAKVMREVPVAYNAWFGRDIVNVRLPVEVEHDENLAPNVMRQIAAFDPTAASSSQCKNELIRLHEIATRLTEGEPA